MNGLQWRFRRIGFTFKPTRVETKMYNNQEGVNLLSFTAAKIQTHASESRVSFKFKPGPNVLRHSYIYHAGTGSLSPQNNSLMIWKIYTSFYT